MECKADDKLAAQMLSESYHGYWMPLPAILALRAQFSRFGVGPVDMLTGSENQPKHMLRPIRPRRVTRKEKEDFCALCNLHLHFVTRLVGFDSGLHCSLFECRLSCTFVLHRNPRE